MYCILLVLLTFSLTVPRTHHVKPKMCLCVTLCVYMYTCVAVCVCLWHTVCVCVCVCLWHCVCVCVCMCINMCVCMHNLCVCVCAVDPSSSCWFCLGSPEVEKHLVVSVATEVGGLRLWSTFSHGHVISCYEKQQTMMSLLSFWSCII